MGESKRKKMSGIVHPYLNREIESAEKLSNDNLFYADQIEEIGDLSSRKFEYKGSLNDDEYCKEKAVEEFLGFSRPRPPGYNLAIKVHYHKDSVKPHVHPDGTKSSIYIAKKTSIDNDEHRSCVGLVLSRGNWSYKDDRFEGDTWCQTGDYVVFKRSDAISVDYRGMKMVYLADDRIHGVVEDPDYVTRDKSVTDLATKKFSYIEDCEEQEAKDLIKEHLGFNPPGVAGWQIVVKIHMRESELTKYKNKDGSESLIYVPPTSKSLADQQFTSRVGLVLSVGRTAYKSSKFGGVPWCKPGDWIVMPRYGKTQINYRGVQVLYLDDDMVLDVIQDPEHVSVY